MSDYSASKQETLRDVLPQEFFAEHMDSKAGAYLDVTVSHIHINTPWVGGHKNVHIWWQLSNGLAVGWNENPARGWSFPIAKMSTGGN